MVGAGVAVGDGVSVGGISVGVAVCVGVGVSVGISLGLAVGNTATGEAVGLGPHAANNKRLKHTTTLLLESGSFILSPLSRTSCQ